MLEDENDEDIELNDFSNLRKEVQRDKEREKKQITHGAKSEQIGLQRLTLTSRKKMKHIAHYNDKKDKMKKIAKIRQRRIIIKDNE